MQNLLKINEEMFAAKEMDIDYIEAMKKIRSQKVMGLKKIFDVQMPSAHRLHLLITDQFYCWIDSLLKKIQPVP